MPEPDSGDIADRTARLLDGLRVFGANYTEFTRRFAASLGLHATDATALMEILYAEDKGTPLTPARLAERISLTSGATTNLLNRLERAGYITRAREHTDRRMVTLRSSPGIVDPATRFFGPFSEHFESVAAQHSEQDLDRIETFLDQLRVTMHQLLDEPGPDGQPRSRPRSGRTA